MGTLLFLKILEVSELFHLMLALAAWHSCNRVYFICKQKIVGSNPRQGVGIYAGVCRKGVGTLFLCLGKGNRGNKKELYMYACIYIVHRYLCNAMLLF
jgi:hypothetical protein